MKLSLTKAAIGFKEYVILGLGMFLYAFGWTACIIPAGGMGGGATGMSMLLNAVFPAISLGQFVFIINGILLLIGGFIVGWNFGIKTIYCIIMLSIAMDAWGMWLPDGTLLDGEVIANGLLVEYTLTSSLLCAKVKTLTVSLFSIPPIPTVAPGEAPLNQQ